MLTIKRPTSTTVLYTVSTRSPTTTLTAHLLNTLLLLARLLLGFLTLTALLWEYRAAIPNTSPTTSFSKTLEHLLTTPPTSTLLPHLTTHVPLPARLALYLALLALALRKSYTEESLLVIRGLGVQTSTSGPSYLWSSSTSFIPTSAIQDILIHEAFKGFEVRFYLSIVVEGEEDVVVVFPKILPRREILEDVWRGARACLYEPKT
ncbi:GPI-GlcNAc transferase complex, PIG-H component-domain-containing protein [Neohortaea acidophila]|uniref:GPI-GlcNAc transferase complex, PIG-H component-domain-containing protein n=1 Tax=Neohortaea acidophila TaxID=245834 RepID=A0A6A6PKK9_9PEZI|nr:GPI-GlcNAc transferase complex, PIG-H component-domain-containing protein [Neohortaea acidophila]KAF2480204.1 GPI-GlcNAc transferase complex, PIG-H component-domain-containing protein [Neohortaea acidophila]